MMVLSPVVQVSTGPSVSITPTRITLGKVSMERGSIARRPASASEDDATKIFRMIRICESLDAVAEAIVKQDFVHHDDEKDEEENVLDEEHTPRSRDAGERELPRNMGELRLKNGSVRFFGGTSHLIYVGDPTKERVEPGIECRNPAL